jgi:hypothetical protein
MKSIKSELNLRIGQRRESIRVDGFRRINAIGKSHRRHNQKRDRDPIDVLEI